MANVLPSYRGQSEVQFLKLMMAEEIENCEYTPGPTFRQESMLYVFKKYRIVCVPIYSDRFLKMKIKSSRKNAKNSRY
ncbi:hypothetical protein PHJA_002825300 [Phtheirospermum japonicum]|uniref:Uncharacterized protein n=1 Tax=Phtheirospermum japonicum TaxID=374723 RepID=A0A830D828_9LAMI|nr:hypothetical protein PHJA_002787100 [Phtheirospermum japonicum]GFQ06432.1 hypothetical protein PHJA_002787200 [Phtheirospermum japonicum]GFQ06813.1 hypothetical protein PHJA_002825300 [Phtheirospermum japonicum]